MKFRIWSIFFVMMLLGCQTIDYDAMKEAIKEELEVELKAEIAAHYEAVEVFGIEEFNVHVSEVATNIQTCTVGIEVFFTSGNPTTGSGVIYKQEGNSYYLLTNEHVIRYHQSIEVYVLDLEEPIIAEVIKTSTQSDLALLKIETNLDIVPCVIKEVEYTVGNIVFAVGSMVDIAYRHSVTIGIISAISDHRIQHDAAINVGSSGGPLFNLYGEFIGLNVSKISTTSATGTITPVVGVGFAIPLETIIDFIT